MYWISKTDIEAGLPVFTYSYFTLVNKPITSYPYYNSFTKQIEHPARYELIIETRTAKTEQEFEDWYQKNKKL